MEPEPVELAISKTHIFVLRDDGTIFAANRNADPVVFSKLPIELDIFATHIATDRMCNLYLSTSQHTYFKIWFRRWGPCDLLYRRLEANMPTRQRGTGRVFVSDSHFGLQGPTCEWASVRHLSLVRTRLNIDKPKGQRRIFTSVPIVEYVTAIAYTCCRTIAHFDT